MVESSIVLSFSGGPAGTTISTVKHVTLAIRDVTFPIVLRIPTGKDDFARDVALKGTGRHGILDRATGPPKELVLIYIGAPTVALIPTLRVGAALFLGSGKPCRTGENIAGPAPRPRQEGGR